VLIDRPHPANVRACPEPEMKVPALRGPVRDCITHVSLRSASRMSDERRAMSISTPAHPSLLIAHRYVVDLRLLQLAAVIDVDRLPLREDVQRGGARLAVAVAGRLRTPEW